jgi:hypothetical protein
LVLHCTIIIQFLPNIVHHILSWQWIDVIQRKLPFSTKYRWLGTRCAIGLVAAIDYSKPHWAVQFHLHLGPCRSSSVIKVCDDFTVMQTTISITLLTATRQLTNIPPRVTQTGNCRIRNSLTIRIDN